MSSRLCSECGNPHYAKGLCHMHWQRLRRHGDVNVVLPGNRKHGHSKDDRGGRTSEYRSWQAMKDRCLNPKNTRYHYYGERGVSVCARWIASFADFLADVGLKPSSRHTLERKNNDGNYERDSVRWATRKEQANNRRSTRVVEGTA